MIFVFVSWGASRQILRVSVSNLEGTRVLMYSTRFTFDTLARAKNEQLSGTNPNMLIVLKCIKRYFTREFDISISLGGASGRPTGTCI